MPIVIDKTDNICACPHAATVPDPDNQTQLYWNPDTNFCECVTGSITDPETQLHLRYNENISLCDCPSSNGTITDATTQT